MSERLPEQVDPLRLARQGATLRGVLPLSQMRRLGEYLHHADGEVALALEFGMGEGGIGYLRGDARTQVAIICQRCLEPMELTLEAQFLFGLVESETEADRLGADYEPLVAGQEPLRLSELAEDELILALPIVALHDEGECPAASRPEQADSHAQPDDARPNPFAVLEQLKHKH